MIGWKVYQLEIGAEFSIDEGKTWFIVETEPSYVCFKIEAIDKYHECDKCNTLHFVAHESISGKVIDFDLNDNAKVLLKD